MNQGDQKNNVSNSEEITLRDLVAKIRSGIRYIKSKWVTVLAVSILGALLGLCYTIFQKTTYSAVCTFVLEDAKTGGGLGQYAGLASIAVINIGGGGGGGIFEGNNILELYKSRTMIEKALLSTCSFDGKKQMLIDKFLDYYNLRSKNHENINFNGDPDNFNRKQDSIITNLVGFINSKILTVTKPDKSLNIIRVEVVTKNELFSKYFTEKLVQTVNDFYVQTKTKKEYQNVQILQHQADSVKVILNSSINGVAYANDAAPNANPAMSALKTTSQKRQIDVQANSAIYSEMVKNLELSKISLRQQMPLIQVIDKPVLPLQFNHLSKLKSIIIGSFLGCFIIILLFILKKIYIKLI